MQKLKIITSWDDGHPLDFKIAELLEKYRLPGIFFVPLKNSRRKVMTSRQIKKLSQKFEIGAHSLSHVDLTRVSFEKAEEEIFDSKKELEEITGKPIKWFCFPQGKYNPQLVLLAKKAGFEYARTASWFHIERSKSQFLVNPTIHFYPHSKIINLTHLIKEKNTQALKFYFQGGMSISPFVLSKFFLEKAKKEARVFHLWGHSWEIEEANLWGELEETFSWLVKQQKRGAWEEEELKYWDQKVYAQRQKRKKRIRKNYIAGNRNYPLENNLFSKIRPIIKGKKLLEIGCGDAAFVANLLDPNFFGYDYVGVDLSENALKMARENIKNQGARFFQQSMETLSVANFECDILLAIGAIHHAESQERLIKKLTPLVRKKGYLLLNEPLFRPGFLGRFFRQLLKPIRPEIEHEARLDERKIIREVKKEFKIIHLGKEVTPFRTFLILFLADLMEKSTLITKIVTFVDCLCIKTLGKIFPVFGGGELYIVAQKK